MSGQVRRTPPGEPQAQLPQIDELRRFKAELKRLTEERETLKRPQRTLTSSSGEVLVYRAART